MSTQTGAGTGPGGAEEFFEAFLPIIILGLVGLVLWFKKAAIVAWLLAHNILTDRSPLITVYAGAGLDLQRLLLLVLPSILWLATTGFLISAAVASVKADRDQQPNRLGKRR